MTSDKPNDERLGKPADASPEQMDDPREQSPQPEWTSGLKQLYDSVVKEPLPDSFKDILDQLDAGDSATARGDERPGSDPRDAQGAGS